MLSTIHTTDATQTISRVLSFYPPHQHSEIRMLLSTALAAVISMRLVPRADGKDRVPATEVLINTATVADNIRDTQKALAIPDLIAQGGMSYGMQSFDPVADALVPGWHHHLRRSAVHSTHPGEFALRVSGVSGTSDRTFSDINGGDRALMFRKVMIANRGEIALRVIRACRELGVKTVAVYSEADRESLHVRFADDDVCIGPPPRTPVVSAADPVIDRCRGSHRCRRHPSGLRFPRGERRVCRHVSCVQRRLHRPHRRPDSRDGRQGFPLDASPRKPVSTVPGSRACSRMPMRRSSWPKRSAFRSSSRQRRVVAARACASPTIRSSSPELFSLAQNRRCPAFGNGDVYVEKYLDRPRHIEFQVLGDTHGTVIHLGERDCSVQRRHQKLIEESPSPALNDDLRARMGASAVGLAAAINYAGARTIRVPARRRRVVLLHGDEHPHPGRASRDGDDHGCRSREGADPRRGWRTAFVRRDAADRARD